MLHKPLSIWSVYFLYIATIFLSIILQVHAADDDTCSFCPENHYCTQGDKKACPSDSSSPSQSSSKTACLCDPGFYGSFTNGDGIGTCGNCMPDLFCNGGAHIQNCPDFSSSPEKSSSVDDCTCLDTHWEPSSAGESAPYERSHVCVDCTEGYWCGDGDRNMCPTGSSALIQSTQQTDCKCKPGYTGADGSECTKCLTGTYKKEKGDGLCTQCPVNTYQEIEAATAVDKCLGCKNHAISPLGSKTQDACVCDVGYSLTEDNTCKQCEFGSYKSTTGDTSCIKCPAGYFSTTLGATSQDECMQCPANTISLEGSDTLNDCICKAGYTADQNGVVCMSCLTGQYKSELGFGDCQDCPSNTFAVSTITNRVSDAVCNECPDDSISPPRSVALTSCTCPKGYTGPDGAPCTICGKGTYKDEKGSSDCTSCPRATYSEDEGSRVNSCEACPSDSDSLEASIDISACICNDKFHGSGVTGCETCDADSYCSGGDKFNCPSNSASPASSDNITDCVCIPGYVGSPRSDDDDTPCQKCTIGRYCTGGTSVAKCPAHSTSPQNSDELTDCECIGGYQGDTETGCELCPADTYCKAGALSQCPENSDSPVNSTSITDCICAPGYHGENGETCTICESNTYCVGGNTAPQDCKDNSASLAGSDTVMDCICEAGWYNLDNVCTVCPANSWCHTGNQTECPENTLSPEGSTHINACICTAGHTGLSNGARCTACIAGSYKVSTGTASCSDCPINTYSTKVGANTPDYCTQCADDSSSPTGSPQIERCRCNAGYTGYNGGTCSPCPAGTYKSTKGTETCTNCNAGTFSTDSAATSASTCETCPTDSTSNSGTGSEENCGCNDGFWNTNP